MGGASREGSQQELIMDRVFHQLRNLDKSTWCFYDKVSLYGQDLIDDAQYIISQLNQYIEEIKNQMAVKK